MAHFIGAISARSRIALCGSHPFAPWHDVRLRDRLRDESGAVTVDWVVLTAAVIGLAFGAISQISSATTSLSTKISSGIADENVGN